MSTTPRSTPLAASVARASRRRARGFTLIELLVALLAGLIVGLGVIGLSREATATFHEEVRIATVQMSLRTAIDRLRMDLQRASYMSTGNIRRDPNLAFVLGGVTYPIVAGYHIDTLAGVRLSTGAASLSYQNTQSSSAAQNPPLSPDTIEISGNFTGSDEFEVISVAAVAGGCQQIFLNPSTPAMSRIIASGTNAPTMFAAAFFPTDPGGVDAGKQFFVRFVDDTGRAQYLLTCSRASNTPTAMGPTNFSVANPSILVDSNTHVLTANETGDNGGIQGFGEGSTVAPVQTVRWQLGSMAGRHGAAAYAAITAGGDGPKYDLIRSFIAADGASVAAGTEVATPEPIAEFAVDLKFAFTVDTSADTSGANPSLAILGFSDANNATTWGCDVGVCVGANIGPQRIRSIRYRLATRGQFADRSADIPGTANGWLYRYCTAAAGCTDGAQQWARVRAVAAEAALPNQARMYY